MAFGVKKNELKRYKKNVANNELAILTHYWSDDRFPDSNTVTKVAANDLETLKAWGKKLQLYDYMIDPESTKIPHFDLFGPIQVRVLKELKRWNMLNRFHLMTEHELEEEIMPIVLKNEQLTVEVNPQGAELTSIKDNHSEIEYLWSADKAFWGRHAPVLFPIVGKLKDDQYQLGGQTYQMTQHGFARDGFYDVVSQTDKAVSLRLESSADTRKLYPFDFTLTITYTLEENTVRTSYHVENGSQEVLPFSIGAHPGFNVPLVENTTFDDYYLSFSPRKTRTMIPLVGPHIDLNGRTLGQTNTEISLNRALFKNDALIYETKGENTFSIQSDKTEHGIDVTFKDFPYTGIWSPYHTEAPFVCIEPWFGIADSIDSTGQFLEKIGLQKLDPNHEFETYFDITVY